ncbi:hypothetical protein [Neisseria sp. P0019.S003]|uniref:hypothetical protein n=1 Tax=Neisseria sp. P0019.S003 TaxID=3436799 RepID=UPI003F803147
MTQPTLANFGELRMDYSNFKDIGGDIINIYNNCKDKGIASCLESVKSNPYPIIYVLAAIILFIVFKLYKNMNKKINNKQQDEKAKIEEIRKRCLEVIIDLYQVAEFCEFDLSKSLEVSSKLWVKASRKSKWIKGTSYRSDKNPFDSIEKDAKGIKDLKAVELIKQGSEINNSLLNFRQKLETNDIEIHTDHKKEAYLIKYKAINLLNEYKVNLTERQKNRFESINNIKFSPSISKWKRCFCKSKKYKPSEEYYELDTQAQYPDNDLDDDK